MELPTYTNIWKIEKRLYKLYDFRLPMPLPIGQVAAFLAIAVPYMLVLTMAGMPFSHTWIWLYVLPPGVLAWLVTRPVLEGKRLPELVLSQLRYVGEPRTWCRMAPLAEKDDITVVARVWRRAAALEPAEAMQAGPASADAGDAAVLASPPPAIARPAGTAAAASAATPSASAGPAAAGASAAVPVRPVWPSRPALSARATPASRLSTDPPARPGEPADSPMPARRMRARAGGPPASPARESARATQPPARPAPGPPATPARPGIRVRTDSSATRPLPVVERALRSPASGWHNRVVVVPGGHRPGKPDQVQRDQARARLPVTGPARVVVLGCTAGAGQTVTTLLTGQLLASLRGAAVAVLDLGTGPGSLTEQARQIPRLLPASGHAAGSARRQDEPLPRRERGLQVVTADSQADEPADAAALIDTVAARYPLTLADPAAGHVSRALHVADQLVLVAPASQAGPGALAMTLEWLDGHGHADLARAAITVLNGVSDQTAADVERAAAVAGGRCRAIVLVPWDGGLGGAGPLGVATVQAYTAVAGVLVSGLAELARPPAVRSRGAAR